MKNRIMCAPMVFGAVVQNPEVAPRMYRKVEASARGGAALVCVGETSANADDAERFPFFEPIDFGNPSGAQFETISRYAHLIKKHGAIALIELCHAGGEKNPLPGQADPWGPTAFTRADGQKVQAMDKEMMEKVCRDFARAATYMGTAGFDGVLVHAAHGWLFSQFLSPLWNKRTDQYGGSLANRARFPLAVFKAIREAIGPDSLLQARISGRDGLDGGIQADEVGQFVHLLEGVVDTVHISSGVYTDPVATGEASSIYDPHGCNVELAAIVRSHTSMPVGVVGGINSPEQAEEILAQGKADYVVLGRQMIADPEFPRKAQTGRENEIRRCIRCFKCFPGSQAAGYEGPDSDQSLLMKVGSCSINPTANLPTPADEMPMPAGSRKVLVVGGGIAGMQAAITATDRGHEVTLMDRGPRLGGLLGFTDMDVDKLDLRVFKDLLVSEVRKRPIRLVLGTRVDATVISDQDPDFTILAIGSSPQKPNIPGAENAISALDVYSDGAVLGKRIVMIGGGLMGCEVGIHLARAGCRVTIVEMLDRPANESYGIYRDALLREMERLGIEVLTGAACTEIGVTGVRVKYRDGTEGLLEADTVVYAVGMRANDTSQLKQALGDRPFVEIGDCTHPARIDAAVRGGFLAAMSVL